MLTIAKQAKALADGRATSRSLVEESLARIADPSGEGARAFIKMHADSARAMADAMDALRRAGRAPSPYAGIPSALKDLLDVAGEPTPAGSRVLANAPPAREHAVVVRRLLAAGFVPVGRTNMTEFAFSGLGINPHYDTPRSPWDRPAGRIPGGSSSGSAVAVADGMVPVALGTDTGGSCRIPAAFCGVVGYKPTARRVPTQGVLPLSFSLDSVGPIGASVSCCAIVDAILAAEDPHPPELADITGLRLAVPQNFMLEGLAPQVGAAFAGAISSLSAAGARLIEARFPELDELPAVNATGGFAAAEAFAWHRGLLAERGGEYDPWIRRRIERGARISAADYVDLVQARGRLTASFNTRTAPYDALLVPTCPIVPARIADLEDEREYNRVNLLSLRNAAPANFFDRCAISLPCHAPGSAPVGLMLMGERMADARLFAIAAAVESVLNSR